MTKDSKESRETLTAPVHRIVIDDDDALEITASDLLTLVKPDHQSDVHTKSRSNVELYGMTINGEETFDPDFVVGIIKLTSLKVGKREIDLEC